MWKWVNFAEMTGQGDKGWQNEFCCPYHLCESNTPFASAKKPKMKFMQKLGPMVYQYRCKYCGCLTNVDVDTYKSLNEPENLSHMQNPAFNGGKASYENIRK